MINQDRLLRSCVIALAAVCVGVLPAGAGEYHYGASLLCADCHTMHFSQQHNWDGTMPVPTSPAPDGNWLGATGPNRTLLKIGGQVSNLCLACHDGQTFAPDVLGANTNGYVRAGGGFSTGVAPYEEWKGHTRGTNVPPGGFAVVDLQCTSCHAYHGNSGFRNIGGNGQNPPPITYALGTNNLTRDVFLRAFTPTDLATNYAVANEDLNEPNSTRSAIGNHCRSCHVEFHGRAGDANMGGSGGVAWLRHPSADSNIGQFQADQEHSSIDVFRSKAYRVKVLSATGDWGTPGSPWPTAPGTLTPTCTSCHKAHGNQNPFGLIYLAGSGPETEEGDIAGSGIGIRSLCAQCHVQ